MTRCHLRIFLSLAVACAAASSFAQVLQTQGSGLDRKGIQVSMAIVPQKRADASDLRLAPDPSLTYAQERLAAGDSLFRHRAVSARGDKADGRIIRSAMRAYRDALNASVMDRAMERISGARLLRAYYFLGCFAASDAERPGVFDRARKLADTLITRYPDDLDIAYWWAVDISLWAKESGPVQAVRAGVPDRVRYVTERLIRKYPNRPETAGMYQILGRMHHLLPRIPFVLGWPDDGVAERCLRAAVKRNPADVTSRFFLAELLRDQGRKIEAKAVARSALKQGRRIDQQLEDFRTLYKVQALLASLG